MSECVKISRSMFAAPPGPCGPSQRVLETAAMFGLGVDDQRELTIVPPCEIPVPAPGIVFITGPSGAGKSTILKLLAEGLTGLGRCALSVGSVPTPSIDEAPLVDAIGSSLDEAASRLSLVGLGDAFVMTRRAGELSDGQRYRFNLARIIELAEGRAQSSIIFADEFAATLDRLTAQTIARNIRRWIDQSGRSAVPHTFIAATSHDDLLEALRPDVLVWKGLGDRIEVVQR